MDNRNGRKRRNFSNKDGNSNKYHPSKNNPVLRRKILRAVHILRVVGNGVVFIANYGDAIDAHDAVFGFNDGPTVGFENKVGSKTTFELLTAWTRTWLRRKPEVLNALLLFGAGAAKSMDALYKKWGSEESIYFMAWCKRLRPVQKSLPALPDLNESGQGATLRQLAWKVTRYVPANPSIYTVSASTRP